MSFWKADGIVNLPWMHSEVLPQVRDVMNLRVRLMPYLYTLMWRAALADEPVVRPLLLDFSDDPAAVCVEDAFLLGSYILVAPVLDEGTTRRSVYLPLHPGGWYDWHDGRHYAGGAVVGVEAPLGRPPLFARGGALIPCEAGAGEREFILFGEPGQEPQARLYEDDGETANWHQGAGLARRFAVNPTPDGGAIVLVEEAGRLHPTASTPTLRQPASAGPVASS